MPQLESGDKIIMPPSALDRLASLHIEYPMLFEVHNAAAERTSHCGVLEFIAEEGMIYMPYWMMQNLLLQEGDMVFIKNANLPKGTYVKLQPHTTDFLDISNPKAILEKTLRNYSCLTTGDSIMVAYNNKKYYIDIVETKPSHAISIIETDCEVDFAPPLDYKEPEKPKPTVPLNAEPTAEAAVEEEPKFTPFTGSGRRLDGKASKDKDVLASSPAKRQANASNGVQPSLSSTSQSSSSRKPQESLSSAQVEVEISQWSNYCINLSMSVIMGGIKVQQDSLYSKEIAWVIVAASEIVLWIVKAIPKVLLFAVVYHIWGKPVARDIKAIRRLLEEQRRDSAKR
ncbi:hypothetical protein PR202_gb06423 [Eleusine coracana subsp. coracana]|uniref:Uncharacterized protein n=1 Tax=Eleusine coracana subsp. coracana TaxID=191504 RepID=A0AAV5E7T2_ELECO|nr:hypothetical protein PR202_gb06423 [Eleusine coracana subsp. coracana]